MSFRFPYTVHGLTEARGPGMLVQIEHTMLLQVHSHALAHIETELKGLPKPKYSGTPAFDRYWNLEHARQNYVDMIAWLQELRT